MRSVSVGCIIFALAFLLVPPVTAQPAPAEQLADLFKAALGRYFDPSSVFEVSAFDVTINEPTVEFDSVYVLGKPAYYRSTPVDFLLQIKHGKLHLPPLRDKTIVTLEQPEALMIVRVTAQAAEQAVGRLTDIVKDPHFEFRDGRILAGFILNRDGRLRPAQMVATLVAHQPQQVFVEVESFAVAGQVVPPSKLASQLAQVNPVLDLGRLPFDLRIQRLNVHNNVIEILATSPSAASSARMPRGTSPDRSSVCPAG